MFALHYKGPRFVVGGRHVEKSPSLWILDHRHFRTLGTVPEGMRMRVCCFDKPIGRLVLVHLQYVVPGKLQVVRVASNLNHPSFLILSHLIILSFHSPVRLRSTIAQYILKEVDVWRNIEMRQAWISYVAEENEFYLHCGGDRSVFLVRNDKVFEVADPHKPGFKASHLSTCLIDDGGSSADVMIIEDGDSIALSERCIGAYELQVSLTRPTLRFEPIEGSVTGQKYPVFVGESNEKAPALELEDVDVSKKRPLHHISKSSQLGGPVSGSSSSGSSSSKRKADAHPSSSSSAPRPLIVNSDDFDARPFSLVSDFNVPRNFPSLIVTHFIPILCHNNSKAAERGFEWGTYAAGDALHIHQPNLQTGRFPHQIDYYSVGKTRANARIGVMPDPYALFLSPFMNAVPRLIRMRFEFGPKGYHRNSIIKRRMVQCFIYGPESLRIDIETGLRAAKTAVEARFTLK